MRAEAEHASIATRQGAKLGEELRQCAAPQLARSDDLAPRVNALNLKRVLSAYRGL